MPLLNAHKRKYKEVIRSAKTAIKQFDLVYVSDGEFPISRIENEAGFSYEIKGKPLKNKQHLKRIGSLALPPAWKGVKITDLSNGHLQAVGRDGKNRKQYRYHPKWSDIRNKTKFFRIADFGKSLPLIRKQVDYDLEQRDWSKSKVIALVIRMMEETHIRIGNEKYAKQNKSYGLTTLRKRHMNIDKNILSIEFIGKKGKKHYMTIKNKKLIRLVSKCEEIPGWEVFKYYDENGQKKVIDSTSINHYLNSITGEFYSAKDFRTWAGSLIFFETLKDFGISQNPKEIKSNILTAYKQTAIALGNTRTVCKGYYVHPLLVSKYEDGTISNYFKKVDYIANDNPYLSNSEAVMLTLFKQFAPELV